MHRYSVGQMATSDDLDVRGHLSQEDDDAGFSGDEAGISQHQLDRLEFGPFCSEASSKGGIKVVVTRKRQRDSGAASKDCVDFKDKGQTVLNTKNDDDDAGFSGDEAGISQKQLDFLEAKEFCPQGAAKVMSINQRGRDSSAAAKDSTGQGGGGGEGGSATEEEYKRMRQTQAESA